MSSLQDREIEWNHFIHVHMIKYRQGRKQIQKSLHSPKQAFIPHKSELVHKMSRHWQLFRGSSYSHLNGLSIYVTFMLPITVNRLHIFNHLCFFVIEDHMLDWNSWQMIMLSFWNKVLIKMSNSSSSLVFSSPEPKAPWWAYRIGRPPSTTLLKHLLRSRLSMGWENGSLFKRSRSHDQDDRHAHIW